MPKFIASASVRIFAVSLAALFCCLSVLPGARAQAPDLSTVNGQTQTPIPGSGHDYQHMLGETVDPSNGAVNFKISFPVAQGRGITLPYAWSYNSVGVNPLNMIDGNQPAWDDKAIQSGAESDGWNTYSGIPYAAVSVWTQTPPANQYQTFAGCNIQSGMTFTDMSGTLHNLYTAAEATTSTQSGLVQSCETQSYMPANGDGQVTAKPDPNTATNDLATDLSPSTGTFVVIDKNGTTYSFPGYTSPQATSLLLWPTIEDRNGNEISMFPSGSNALYTDSAGRPGPIVTGTSVTVNSGTADQLVFTPTWESITVAYSPGTASTGGQAAGVGCVGLIPNTVSGTRTALKSLMLPNGESYQFQYNSYGTLSQITYPDGGWVSYGWELPTGSNNSQYNQIAFWSGQQTNTNPNGTIYYTPVSYGCSQLYQTPVLASRTVSFDGTTTAQTQAFSYSTTWASSSGAISNWSAKTTTVTTTDQKTGLVSTTVYNYIPWGVASQPYASLITAPSFPVESEIDYYDWGQSSMTRKVNKTWYDQFNLASETTTIVKTGQVSETKYTYVSGLGSSPSTSSFVYLSEQDDYDYSSSSTPIKKTMYKYRNPVAMPQNFPTYLTYTESTDEYPMMFPPLVSSVTIENGSGAIQAATNYTYDGSGLTTVTPTQHDSNYSSSMTTRGNLTSVTHCNPAPSSLGASCSGPTVSYAYDTSGQPTSMTDANGNTTQYSFADSFSDDTSAPSTNAYLTKITYPSTSGGSLIKSFEYSYYLGYLTYSTDENSQTTSYHYGTEASQCSASDSMFRLTEIDYPPTSAGTSKTQNCYNDTAPSPTVQTWKLINSSLWEENIATMDGMEHVVKTQLYTDPGGADIVLTTYNGEGRVFTVTNSFRGTSPPAHTTVTNYYDVFGRSVETKEQDGSIRQWCYDNLASSTGTTPAIANCTSLLGSVGSGTFVDSTDENGNHWQHTSDVFGRLTEVMEPNGSAQTPTMETDYTYDVLNDLLSVTQWGGTKGASGARSRSFTYNSLSRLGSATNPETGSIGYTYDPNGNVVTKTDARAITTQFVYDPLNRLVSKTYSNDTTGTAISCFQYDTSSISGVGGNLKGRLTNAWTQATKTSCTGSSPYFAPQSGSYLSLKSMMGYDAMGHLLGAQQQQCIGATCSVPTPYSLTMAYDLAGNMTTLTNSVGASGQPLTLNNYFDGAGRPCLTTSTWSDNNSPLNLFQTNPSTTTAGYAPFGGLQNWYMGGPSSSSASTSCSSTPSSPVNITTGYTNRFWVNSTSATGQIP